MAKQKGSIVVFDAHPDDADWWTGGLTLLLTEKGWDVHYVCVTPANEVMRTGALDSAGILGAERHFLEVPITANPQLSEQLLEKMIPVMKNAQPVMVFVPAFTDYHAEHTLLTRTLLPLLRRSIGGRFGFGPFEIYGCDSQENREPIEVYLDISDVFDKVLSALSCHTLFARKRIGNSLCRVKTGRSMCLGACLPHPSDRVEYAEGYRIIFGEPKQVSTLRLLFPERFYYRPTAWLETL